MRASGKKLHEASSASSSDGVRSGDWPIFLCCSPRQRDLLNKYLRCRVAEVCRGFIVFNSSARSSALPAERARCASISIEVIVAGSL